jgi:hypothetical protein
MTDAIHADKQDARKSRDHILLRVIYAPVRQPLVLERTPVTETLADIKSTALTHFQLAEGDLNGGTKTYFLSFDDIVQTNLNVTVGELGHNGQATLLLVEQFVQG